MTTGPRLLKSSTEYDLWLVGSRLAITKPGVRLTSTSWEAFWDYDTELTARGAASVWDMTKDRDPSRDGMRVTADARPPWDPTS